MSLDKYLEKKSIHKSLKRIDSHMKDEQVINAQREQEWLKENKEAIEKQNGRMKIKGLFGDAYRRF